MLKLTGQRPGLPEILRPEDVASSLRVTLYCVLGFSLFGLIGALQAQDSSWSSVALNSILLASATGAALIFLQLRRMTLAIYTALIANALVLAYAAWIGAGVNGVAYAGLILPVLAAALFLGPRAGYLSALIAMLIGAFLFFAGRLGWLVNIDRPITPIGAWLANALFFFVAAHQIGVSLRQVEPALHRAHDEINKRAHTEEKIRRLNEELEQRIAERTKQLAASEERYRLIAENADDFIWTTDMELHPTYISPALRRALGYAEASQIRPERVLTPASLKNALGIFADEIAHASAQPDPAYTRVAELEFKRQDGTTFWGETKFVFLRDPLANLIGVLGVGRDITERKRIEAALREAELRYRTLVEQTSVVIYRDAPDREGTLLYISPQIEKLVGYSAEEWLGRPDIWQALLHPDDRERAIADVAQYIETKNNSSIEYRLRTRDGRWIWVLDESVIVRDSDGTPLFVQGVLSNITERKQAEAALRASEERFRALVEQLPAITYTDAVKNFGKTNYISPQLETFLGITPEEWVEGEFDFWVDHLHPADRERAIREFEDCFYRGIPVDSEYRMFARDGREIWFHDRAVRLNDAEGQPQFIQGVMTNISERKRSEQRLEQQTAQLTALYRLGQAIVASLDLEQVCLSAHHAVEQLFPTEAFYISLLDETHQTVQYPYLVDKGQRSPAGSGSLDEQNLTTHVLKTGEALFIKDNAQGPLAAIGYSLFGSPEDTRSIMIVPLRFGGKVLGTVSAQHYQPNMYSEEHLQLLSILANHVAIAIQNAQLVQSLRLQTVALEAAANAIVITDRENRIQWVNPAFTRLTGYDAAEAMGQNPNLLRSGVHDQAFYQQLWATLNAGHVWHGEIVNRRKDGSLYTEEQTITPVLDERGHLFRFIAVKQDITQRKETELEIQRQRDFALQVMNAMGQGLTVTNHAGVFEYVNPAYARLIGRQPEDLIGLHPQAVTVPEDISKLHEAHAKRQAGQTSSYETRLQHANGNHVEVMITGTPRWKDGSVRGAIAVITDLTERKQFEENLLRERKLLQALMDNIPDTIYFKDRESRFTRVNEAQAHLLGLDAPEEAIGKTDSDFQNTELSRQFFAEEQDMMACGVPLIDRLEYNPRPDGTPRWLAATKVPLHDLDGTIVGLVGISRDISAYKQTEEREQRRRTMLEKVVELGKAITQITDLIPCLREIYQSVQKGLGFDRVGLFLYDPEKHLVRGAFGTSATGEIEDTSWFTQAIHTYDAWQRALSDPHGMNVIDNYRDFHQVAPNNEMRNVKQHVTLAAWAGEQPIALITANNAITQRLFTAEQLEALQLFAGYAGLAIKNAQWNDELERRVIERTTELEAANRELESLSYTIAHDLRSPVRAMVGYSQLLLKSHQAQLDEAGKADLDRIHHEAKRMGELVDDFLTFLRLGQRVLHREALDMTALIKRVWAQARPQRAGREIKLHVGTMPKAQADAELLEQVWAQFIANAIKFTRPRKKARIEIGYAEQAGGPCYYIRDNGIGFDMRYANKIFSIFQRLNRQEDFEGTGIGLAIAQRIIQRHGGRLWAEAEVDQGATFYFTLAQIK